MIATASLTPLEIFELVKHFTVVKVGVIAINLAVVGYLIAMLRNKSARRIHASPRSE